MMARTDPDKFHATPADDRLREAAEITARQILGEAANDKRRILLSVNAQDKISGFIYQAKAIGIDGLNALKRTLVFESDGKSNFLSVESRVESIRAYAVSKTWEAFEATDPRLFGLISNRDGIRAFTMELFGEDSGSEIAKKGAEQFKKIAEELRLRFNAAGGTIASREDWHLPRSNARLQGRPRAMDCRHFAQAQPGQVCKRSGPANE
jgi:hypothetical protein